jgi:hypothetical protein
MVVEEAPIGVAPVPVLDGVRGRRGAYTQVKGNGAVVRGGGLVNGPRRDLVPNRAAAEGEVNGGRDRGAVSIRKVGGDARFVVEREPVLLQPCC